MSFFDEGDEPRRSPRPRRPAGATISVDPQTIRQRQAIAVGGVLVVVLLLAFGVKGCMDSVRKRGLRDYTKQVGELIQSSDQEVGRPFFEQLSGRGGQEGGQDNALNLEAHINSLRVESEDLVRRARRLDPPDAMQPAQGPLVLALEMRRDGLEKIASKVTTAATQSPSGEEAVVQIAGQMQLFYASDLLYEYRVAPVIGQALEDADVDMTVPQTDFFSSLGWLNAGQIAPRLGGTISAARRGGPVAAGTHGHGITSVTVAGVTLQPGVANRIPAGSGLTFTVKLANQGENDETGVVVKVSIEGAGAPVTGQATIPQTAKGTESSVDVSLPQAPPLETPVQINLAIDPVPGEKVTDNNRQSYPAIFTRG